jgi:hypothetical protein
MVVLLVTGIAPAIGCGQIELPVTLALEQPSDLTIELAITDPPLEETTNLVGGVETTIVTNIGLKELLGALVGKAIPADIQIDDILIAGTEILIGPEGDPGALPTGTICLFQDPDLASEGGASFNLLLGVAAFDMTLNTKLGLTDPLLNMLLGGPQPFQQVVSAMVPVSLTDMLALLTGGGSGLALSQDIDASFNAPVLGDVHVTGTLTLASTDTFPSGPLLTECADYIAGL